MKETVLITGATSGIGREMARMLAAQQFNLILVARNGEKLAVQKKEFENSFGIQVTVYALDLSVQDNAYLLFEKVRDADIAVDMLVNNAGIGNYGAFTETSLKQELMMIDLNISAVVILTKLFGREMAKRRSGKIMNVASLLSFLPFPYYSVYSATKSFVLAFTETVAAEMEKSGVTVTALCPGPVDTPFQTKEMLETNAYKANKPVSAAYVAKKGVALLLDGKGKKIPGFNNWFISNLPRITPDYIMMNIKKKLASPKSKS
ncbi:SDR family oxidoreductase [Flavobacterium sp.]|uniref:SDR family NAD(P)-dependent oxidoreductase n=1 Tax=Flavobacterium sp. TaxID=239 RepID=UPI002606E990|nr:SDR family oxidoreductase [Flavobacterium sp.]